MGTVGALFTLSSLITMIGFISIMIGRGDGVLMLGVVTAHTVAIIVTMALIGGGARSLFRLSKANSERFHAISQVVASVLLLI